MQAPATTNGTATPTVNPGNAPAAVASGKAKKLSPRNRVVGKLGKGKGKTNPNAQGKGGKGKASKAPAPRTKEGLRKPQIAILAALAKAKSALSRPEIAAKSGVDPTKIGDYADQSPNRTPEAAARYPFPDLRSLGYVHVDTSGFPRRYSITAKGRAALVKIGS